MTLTSGSDDGVVEMWQVVSIPSVILPSSAVCDVAQGGRHGQPGQHRGPVVLAQRR